MSAYHAFAAALDYDMLIVTAAVRGEHDGCLVGFHTQASIHPARHLVCLSDKNRTYRLALRSNTLVVHLVPDDALDLAELFGGETGDEVDKLAGVEWEPGPGGAPVLARCDAWFAGRILMRVPFGDHIGFLLEPIDGRVSKDARGLGFSRARTIEPGHDA